MPPHVEYSLTPKGEELNGIFEAVAQWGRDWMKPPRDREPAGGA